MKKIVFLTVVGLLGAHLFLLINLQFTAWPEMFSFPFLYNHGYLLYRDMVHPYPPALTLGLSVLYKLFGYQLIVLKLVTWLLILANDILIFLLVKRLTGRDLPALVSLTFYVLLQPALDGNQLWFDLAIVTPVLFGTSFFLGKKYFWAGIGFALAALTKQTAGLFLAVSAMYIVFREKGVKTFLSFGFGSLFLGLMLGLKLISEGTLSGFLNWTLIYPLTYWSKFPGYVQMILTAREWLVVSFLSLPALFLIRRRRFLILVAYFMLSLIIVYPRFSFFHLQLAIAFSAILFGLSFKFLRPFPKLLAIGCLLPVFFLAVSVLGADWQKEARFWTAADRRLAEKIQGEAPRSVYFLGPFSTLYVMSQTLPPKPWLDNFGWYFEIPGVQEEVVRRWRQNPPTAIIWQEPEAGEWYEIGTYQPVLLAAWIKENYNQEKEIKPGIWLWRKK